MASAHQIVEGTLRRHGIEPTMMLVSEIFSDLRAQEYVWYFGDDVEREIKKRAEKLVDEIKDTLRATVREFEAREFGTIDAKPV